MRFCRLAGARGRRAPLVQARHYTAAIRACAGGGGEAAAAEPARRGKKQRRQAAGGDVAAAFRFLHEMRTEVRKAGAYPASIPRRQHTAGRRRTGWKSHDQCSLNGVLAAAADV